MLRQILLIAALMVTSAAHGQSQPKPPLIEVGGNATPMAMPKLIQQLRAGGNILLIRHERTEVPSVTDDYSRPADDCTVQRNLSASGYAGAIETRSVLRALRITAQRVIASPMCRTVETARQMFVTYTTDNRLMHEMDKQGRTNDVAAADLKAVLDEIKATEGNVAIVTHFGLIMRATGIQLSEGEIAVMRRNEAGQLILLRQIMGSDLAPHAREALGPVQP
jgi:broad specificity phosphatase PhoE